VAPYDLQTLHSLRKRGQCPKLPVFVTDCWDWHQKLLDLGALCIRLRNPQDLDHDWSALRGLHCMLLCNDHSMRCQRYEALAWKLLDAKPSQLEAFYPDVQYGRVGPSHTTLVVGVQEPIDKIMRRDSLLWGLLRFG
jgi:hypothetical protein